MSATRRLVIKKTGAGCGCHYMVEVTEQTHRGMDFTPRGHIYKASNGVHLKSVGRIDLTMRPVLVLFVRGGVVAEDKAQVKVTVQDWHKIELAVKEYNQHFSKPDVLAKHGVVR